MILPLQVSFHGLETSAALSDLVADEAAKLERLYRDIISCRVAIERVTARHRHGNPYRVTIEIAVPGQRLVVNWRANARQVLTLEEDALRVRSIEIAPEHKDAAAAIRDAFRGMARRLEDFARRQRGDIKSHAEVQQRAQVTKLFPDEDFGFIETEDGREVYFHRASVLDGAFDRLTIGTSVTFVEEAGENGPQASTLRLVTGPHHAGDEGSARREG